MNQILSILRFDLNDLQEMAFHHATVGIKKKKDEKTGLFIVEVTTTFPEKKSLFLRLLNVLNNICCYSYDRAKSFYEVESNKVSKYTTSVCNVFSPIYRNTKVHGFC